MQADPGGESRVLCERLFDHIEELQKELAAIAGHPTGWPPPEEENMSMRGIADAALQYSLEFVEACDPRTEEHEPNKKDGGG